MQLIKSLDKLSEDQSEFEHICVQCNHLEIKWFAKLILKDLKLGISHQTLLKMYHPHSLDLFNSTADLKQVFLDVADYEKHTGVYKIFFPVKPMLADKLNLKQLADFVRQKANGVYVETKFDGERI